MSGTWLLPLAFMPNVVNWRMRACPVDPTSIHLLETRAGLEVFAAMKAEAGTEPGCRGSRSMRLLGQQLCRRGYMKLLSFGKTRFHKMRAAIRTGAEHCPYDARYIKKGPRPPSAAWMACHDFLMKLWLESAERIPDGLNSRKRPRQGLNKLDHPNMNRSQIKHLPPGSIRDYWKQCQSCNGGHTISRKLFSNATWHTFSVHV